VKTRKLKPWRTAAECIDWSIPAPSIFECKKWLREHQPSCQLGSTKPRVAGTPEVWSTANAYIASSQKVQRRAMPSGLKLISEAS